MKKTITFLYERYYDFDKEVVTIGGIQTYLTELMKICLGLGYDVQLFQMGDTDRHAEVDGISIVQTRVEGHDYEGFFRTVADTIHGEARVVFGTDIMVPKDLRGIKAIGIQHGIFWDVPTAPRRGGDVRMFLSKALRNYKFIRRVRPLDTLVCVDYNYVNWLRAETDCVRTNLRVIPNYTKIAPVYRKPEDTVNIIFARRLWEYRGTRVFAEAAGRIVREYGNVHVTVAGTGPDEKYMRDALAAYPNVSFITYGSSESLGIHADKHIAVVPTVGSEGTSLSLLEAMSAQCAVIASNVGGMTNIILDDYNGVMVNAGDADDLYRAMKRLIDNPDDRKRLSGKAYETVRQAFSYEKWSDRWTGVLKSFME